MTAVSKRFKGGEIVGSSLRVTSLTLFLFCELSKGLASLGLSSIKRTGSPVEVNIFGGAILNGGRVALVLVLEGFDV